MSEEETITAIYLETSAVNWLYDDSERAQLSARLRNLSHVRLSIHTFADLAATRCSERRTGLLNLAREVLCCSRLLAVPKDILKRSLVALQTGSPNIHATMGPEWNGVWEALWNPGQIDKESYSEIVDWKERDEKWYDDMHEVGRPVVQDFIAELPETERKTLTEGFAGLLRHLCSRREFVTDFVSDMATAAGAKAVTKDIAWKAMKELDIWRFFAAGMAYGLYARSIRTDRFGKRSTPGGVDTLQAIYLGACDIFVTSDRHQREMMRLLAPFGRRRRRVWSYEELRQWLAETTRAQ